MDFGNSDGSGLFKIDWVGLRVVLSIVDDEVVGFEFLATHWRSGLGQVWVEDVKGSLDSALIGECGSQRQCL